MHELEAKRHAIWALLLTEPEDGEWVWLCYYRLTRYLEARHGRA